MRWRRVLLNSAVTISFIVVGGATFVAYRVWVTDGCVCGLPERTPFAVYNPLRSREPQHIVETYLQALHQRTCMQLDPGLFAKPTERDAFCQINHPLSSWTLRSVEQKSDEATFGYQVAYGGMIDESDPYWVGLERRNGRWLIVTRDTFY